MYHVGTHIEYFAAVCGTSDSTANADEKSRIPKGRKGFDQSQLRVRTHDIVLDILFRPTLEQHLPQIQLGISLPFNAYGE